jgi:exosortase E/protease (VPEID-CTERM system)
MSSSDKLLVRSEVTSNNVWPTLIIFIGLLIVEFATTSFLFSYQPDYLTKWTNPVVYVKYLIYAGIAFLVIFTVVAWPKRDIFLGLWRASVRGSSQTGRIVFNLAMFMVLAIATSAFSRYAQSSHEFPWLAFSAYILLLCIVGASLAMVVAPLGFWLKSIRASYPEVFAVATASILLLLVSLLAQESWVVLAKATLFVSYWILRFFWSNREVIIDLEEKRLGLDDFAAVVGSECSGYEGIGLVIVFLVIYLRGFRHLYRFPHALLLFPIAICAVWFLNAVRIAALVAIGARVSPAIAVDGFHSIAGWLGFLAVTVSIMLASHKIAFFSAPGTGAASSRPPSPSQRELQGLLAPFLALMAASLVAAMFAPNDRWLVALKVVLVGGAIWLFRDIALRMAWRLSPVAIAAGIAVGILWIATDPMANTRGSLQPWLGSLPWWLALAWIALRALNTVVLVPIAEELAFRGYLYRAIAARGFDGSSPYRFDLLALCISSLLFGVMHQRWIAGALAGAVYCLLVCRSNKLADAVVAHGFSNAAIVFWAIAAGRYSLL